MKRAFSPGVFLLGLDWSAPRCFGALRTPEGPRLPHLPHHRVRQPSRKMKNSSIIIILFLAPPGFVRICPAHLPGVSLCQTLAFGEAGGNLTVRPVLQTVRPLRRLLSHATKRVSSPALLRALAISQCHSQCLRSALSPSPHGFAQAADPPDLSTVPKEDHDLDCGIDLLHGAPLPTSRLYNFSQPEQEAMEKYTGESLASGLIRPSSSPIGFFFVKKKDSSLQPCIDYWSLNEIMVKNEKKNHCHSSTLLLVHFTRLGSSRSWTYGTLNALNTLCTSALILSHLDSHQFTRYMAHDYVSPLGRICTQLPGLSHLRNVAFHGFSGIQPLLFDYQEGVVAVQVNLRRCRSMWRQVRAVPTCSSLRSHWQANCHRVPAPLYRVGQNVWLSSKDLPLQVKSKKLALRFFGSFEVDRVVKVAAVHLGLLASLKIHPTFPHFTQASSGVGIGPAIRLPSSCPDD